jgi:hypothetical protein
MAETGQLRTLAIDHMRAERSAGQLTAAALPGGPYRINVVAVALIPGTTGLLGGGEAHAYANPGSNVVAVILRYGA